MSKREIELMIENQLRARGIKDGKILQAFFDVDRKFFVPKEYLDKAYGDHPVPIGYGQTISQPLMVAEMLCEAKIKEGHKVLEIGSGSGYVLALLFKLGAVPYGIERIRELAEKIPLNLQKAGILEIEVKIGDGTFGWIEKSPFDRIILSAASLKVPEKVLEQLKEGGIIVAPLGQSYMQRLTIIKKTEKGFEKEEKTPCVFVPLISDIN